MTAKQKGETVVSVPAYELKKSLKANRYVLHGCIHDYAIESGRNAAMTLYYGIDVIVETGGE